MSEHVQVPEQTPEQTPPAKVTFSPEQQGKINDLIRQAQGRVGSQARADAAQAQEDAKKARAEALSLKLELAQLRGDKEGLEAATKAIKEENIKIRRRQIIAEAAAKMNFYSPVQVLKLTEQELIWNEDKKRFVVVADDGSERLGIDGNGLTIEAFYRDFAVANPHLVRGDVKTGVGSAENQRPYTTQSERDKLKVLFGKNSDSRAANTLAINNPQEYKRLKREARSHGLIP